MPPTLAPGVLLAQRYRLTRLLGEGGMGAVWAATHTVTRRQVAIKLPRRDVRADMRRRFFREATAMAAIDHPNVIKVHDAFELEDGTPIMVMDLLQGETFASLLTREQSLPLAQTLRILLPVISAVGTAHSHSIVHRDLKPENVFLAVIDGATIVKVLDFGIAKLDPGLDEHATLTTTGSALGTPCYMAPEQSLGERDIDHRADVWSIGVMLYEALTGGRPIEGDNVGQIIKRLLTEAITPIGVAVPSLPTEVQSIIDRMLVRTREERVSDLRDALTILSKHTDVRVPEFGAPRSQGPSTEVAEAGAPSEARRSEGTITTHAPETLKSGPPEMTSGSSKQRIGWVLVGGALVTTAVIMFRSRADAQRDRHAPASAVPSEIAAVPPNAAESARSAPVGSESIGPAPSVEAMATAVSSSAARAPSLESSRPKRRTGQLSSADASSVAAAPVPTSSSRPTAPSATSAPTGRGLAEEVPF